MEFFLGWECWAILTLVVLALPLIYIEIGRGAIHKETIHIEEYCDGVYKVWSDLTWGEIMEVDGVIEVTGCDKNIKLVEIDKRYIVNNILRRIRKLANEKEIEHRCGSRVS